MVVENKNTFSLRTLNVVHQWVQQVVKPGDLVIDGTVGNGHDTVYLAELVGEAGHVVGFDIQEEAVRRTAVALQAKGYGDRGELHAACHSRVREFLSEDASVAVAMFNLGYLPNADKSIITQVETTIRALEETLQVLQPLGLMTIVCYPGHAGGDSEALAVEAWAKELNSVEYSVMKATPHNPRSQAPYIIAIQKGRPR